MSSRPPIGKLHASPIIAASLMRMLIVDDNAQMRLLIRLVMDGIADEIEECEDGVDVLAAYERLRPDWVVMDYEMKHMDGITASRTLTTSFPHAQVVMLTNYDGVSLREAAQEAGAKWYVLKENLLDLRTLVTQAP